MKAHIALLEKGLDAQVEMVPFTADHRYEPRHPDVLRVNPKRQVPVLLHDGVEIFDSTQIFEYLEDIAPEPRLWPADFRARAAARLSEHKSDEVFFPHVIRLMGLQQALEEPAALAARAAVAATYVEMEELLADRDFLAGPYSYADIAFYMAQLFAERMNAPMTEATPSLLAWRDRITKRPAVRRVMEPLVAYLTINERPVPDFLQRMQAARFKVVRS